MNGTCGTCVCSSARREATDGRLVLATAVDHTATALRTLALRRGTRLRPLAPGLLELRGECLDKYLTAAREDLSSVEADEVRCLVVDSAVPDAALLGRAMGAATLSAAASRVEHADMLPLFADEVGRFHADYQPIVELDGRRVIGHEALLRATTVAGEPVLPDVLFPAAESAGWTHVLDRIGRTTALHGAGPWLGSDLLFINFIPTSIYRPQVCLRTTEIAAAQAGLALDQLVFEVTEGHRVRDLDHLAAVFDYYRERGCRVAIDDLGAGYSSLNTLVRLKPDFVKLDKDIVQALPEPAAVAVVSAIVAITHAYGGLVLAECVETQGQADVAAELGVDLGQGWLFGRPARPARGGRPRPAAVAQAPERPDVAVALQAGPVTDQAVSGLLERAVASSASGVVVVDMLDDDHPMLHVNPAFERMSGYAAEEVLGRNCRMLQGRDSDPGVVARIGEAVRRGQEHRAVIRNVRKDGSQWWNELHLSPIRDDAGRLTHYLGFQHDVTARVVAEQQLLHLSTHDGLTGLANRAELLRHLDEVTGGTGALAVLFLDLDGFKAVNDEHGHRAGDAVLTEVAERLRSSLRSGDLLARHGGDEFVAVLAGLDPDEAERVACRVADDLLGALRGPVALAHGTAIIGASIGVALGTGGDRTGSQLLHDADLAMYRAKAGRPGSIEVAGMQQDSSPAATPGPMPGATPARRHLLGAAPVT